MPAVSACAALSRRVPASLAFDFGRTLGQVPGLLRIAPRTPLRLLHFDFRFLEGAPARLGVPHAVLQAVGVLIGRVRPQGLEPGLRALQCDLRLLARGAGAVLRGLAPP